MELKVNVFGAGTDGDVLTGVAEPLHVRAPHAGLGGAGAPRARRRLMANFVCTQMILAD